MADKVSKAQRSRNMARVKQKDTAPEMVVRRTLHRLGYRFRLHIQNLPGKPDIVLPRHSKIFFVHGCFWHGHDCPRGKRPATNRDFWDAKLDKNLERDRINEEALRSLGWTVHVIWGCEVQDCVTLEQRILDLMTGASLKGPK